MAARLTPSDGPNEAGQAIWYWGRDPNKIRGGEWIRGRVVSDDPASSMARVGFKG